jgi:hypothetical protein
MWLASTPSYLLLEQRASVGIDIPFLLPSVEGREGSVGDPGLMLVC